MDESSDGTIHKYKVMQLFSNILQFWISNYLFLLKQLDSVRFVIRLLRISVFFNDTKEFTQEKNLTNVQYVVEDLRNKVM